ncbi:methyltransferase domain-containing protein [Leptospira sp. 96542]|nr:methyltransferase domain-containing protein [Leptospira sp. 96542]
MDKILVNNSFKYLQRIPEPELMSDQIQAEAYSNADFDVPHSFITKQLSLRLPIKFTPRTILDLGSGPGEMVERLFHFFPKTNFTLLEGSFVMSNLCKNRMEPKKNFENQFEYLKVMVQEFVPENSFDFVFSNSLLHHMHDPYEFWAAVQRSVHEDSFVFIADLLRPDSLDEAHSLVERYANNEPEILKTDFFNSLCAAFRKEEIEEMLDKTRLSQKLKWEQITDRHWICYSKPKN